jgi:hypothetical protein
MCQSNIWVKYIYRMRYKQILLMYLSVDDMNNASNVFTV